MAFAPLLTERLRIRTPTESDAADLAERRSDPTTAAWQAWGQPYGLERATDLCRASAERAGLVRGECLTLVVERLADGRVVGDLAAMLAGHGHTCEIGWTLHPWARGHGYATEAAATLCDHLVAVAGVHRLEGHIHPDNTASRRVLERLGLRSEGVLVESFWIDDEVSDDEVFGLLGRDWRPPVAGHLSREEPRGDASALP